MPPVLDPKHHKVDGLAFLGLSLARKSRNGHPDSTTHQQAFDLDLIQDRDYEYLFSSNDDGWLVGGGEPGPPSSYKLAAKDSAHVEIMRIGTYREDWGGLPQDVVINALRRGDILIPEITLVPTSVVANGDKPPELEIRFDMIPSAPNFNDISAPLPLNWQLRFIQNQLFHKFQFASRFTPGAFHSTILRKAEFRSEQARDSYFKNCQQVCDKWNKRGPQPLAPTRDGVGPDIEVVRCVRREPQGRDDDEDCELRLDRDGDQDLQDYYRSGIWLFTDRDNISHQFLPNFLPPYDTPIKKKLILELLKEEWDEKTLSWKKLTSRFDPIASFIPSGLVEGGGGVDRSGPDSAGKQTQQIKMTALPPVQKIDPNSNKKPTNLGILDPNDDDGFTHFVSCIGAEMANMTAEVCGPLMAQAENSDSPPSKNSVVRGEEKTTRTDNSTDPDGGVPSEELLINTMKSSEVKATVRGQRVSKSH